MATVHLAQDLMVQHHREGKLANGHSTTEARLYSSWLGIRHAAIAERRPILDDTDRPLAAAKDCARVVLYDHLEQPSGPDRVVNHDALMVTCRILGIYTDLLESWAKLLEEKS